MSDDGKFKSLIFTFPKPDYDARNDLAEWEREFEAG